MSKVLLFIPPAVDSRLDTPEFRLWHSYTWRSTSLGGRQGTLTKRAGGAPSTPAMAAGVSDRPMTYEQVVGLLDSN